MKLIVRDARNLPRSAGAFTLIEMMVVLGIIVVLAVLATPSIVSLMRSSGMNTSASMVVDQLNLARQLALSQSRDVEVRFYQLGANSTSSDLQYRAFRSFYASSVSPSQAQALGPVLHLPNPVIISGSSAYSTLLDFGNASRSGLTYSQEALPGVSGSTNYVSFLFRSTGGTNLSPVNPPLGNWYLTLYLENAPVNPAIGIPDDYFTAQIDPVSGSVRTYRR